MKTEAPQNPPRGVSAGDPRLFLAGERTFLAWIRTGIALMGFGFILARFGLFLRQIQWMREDAAVHTSGATVWLGVALVVIGVAVNLAATIRHVRFTRLLKEGRTDFNRSPRLAVAAAVTLACVGLITAMYLVIASAGVSAGGRHPTSIQHQDAGGPEARTEEIIPPAPRPADGP